MPDPTAARPPRSFWIIGSLALVWNLLGVVNFAVQMVADDLAGFPDWWRAVVESRPVWATGAMVVAVFGGALGCVFLLLRQAAAYPLFIVSLAAVVVTMSHAVGVGTPGARQVVEAVVLPILVALVLVWYARRARARGWIG